MGADLVREGFVWCTRIVGSAARSSTTDTGASFLPVGTHLIGSSCFGSAGVERPRPSPPRRGSCPSRSRCRCRMAPSKPCSQGHERGGTLPEVRERPRWSAARPAPFARAGPSIAELPEPEAGELRARGGDAGEYGATTGRPRSVGWFDAVLVSSDCLACGSTWRRARYAGSRSGWPRRSSTSGGSGPASPIGSSAYAAVSATTARASYPAKSPPLATAVPPCQENMADGNSAMFGGMAFTPDRLSISSALPTAAPSAQPRDVERDKRHVAALAFSAAAWRAHRGCRSECGASRFPRRRPPCGGSDRLRRPRDTR